MLEDGSSIELTAEQGHSSACKRLGVIYRDGVSGIDPDKRKSDDWFQF